MRRERLNRLIALGALAYLGFWVFGLVMGVFSFWEVPVLTILAGVMVLIALWYHLLVRRTLRDPETGPAAEREMHKQRTERGF
jgi:hypothetical protein